MTARSDRPVALITLASGYVGPALARRMAASGFDLVLHMPSGSGTLVDGESAADDLRAAIEELGSTVEVVTAPIGEHELHVSLRNPDHTSAGVDVSVPVVIRPSG